MSAPTSQAAESVLGAGLGAAPLDGRSFRERVRGKWQIPALLVALVLLAAAVIRLRAVRVHYPIEAYLEQLAARVEAGYYTSAIDYAARLQKRDDLSALERATIHLHSARAHALRAERERRTTPEAAAMVQAEYAAAFAGGIERRPDDLVRWGQSHLWREEHPSALARFEEALALSAPPALPLRRRIIELSISGLRKPAAEVLPLLDEVIRDASDHSDALHWAAATKIDVLASEGRHEDAAAMLEGLRARFEASTHHSAFRYLVALADYRLGRHDEAEAQLRDLRNGLTERDELYAMTGWLLGQVVLSDGRPQRPEEAISFFREVQEAVPRSPYAVACRLGVAESLAVLGRYAESLAEFRETVDRIRENDALRASPLLSADVIRSTASAVGERLRREGRLEPALQFYEFALALIAAADEPRLAQFLEILGDMRVGLARRLRDQVRAWSGSEAADAEKRERLESDARYLLLEAAEGFLRLGRLKTLNEDQSAEAAWRAAGLLEEGGDTPKAISCLERFLSERPASDHVPQVLLRLGQARRSLGMYHEAIEAFQENLRRFPRTPDAGSGLIPLARCYMALGAEYTAMAVETLDVILRDSPVFTPQAPEFRDALFLLGDIHNAAGQHEQSIAVLEEALERYPEDSRALRSRFLLADAYRQSGMALRRESEAPEAASDRPRMQSEAVARYRRAAGLFGELVEELGRVDVSSGNGDSLAALWYKHARLYQADCLFELGRFAEAVALYETAAFLYRNEPSALSAYVQIINCRLSMGQTAEARTTLRRAQYLLQVLPETAFDEPFAGQSRREWERYIDWLERSDLFVEGPRDRGT